MWYIYLQWNITEPFKKNEILPFAMTWMKIGSIMLNEITQSEKDKYHMIHSFVEFKKQNKKRG